MGNLLLLNNGGSLLKSGGSAPPSAYVEVEYIETAGDCSIITDYVPYGNDIVIEGKFKFKGYVDNASWVVWFNTDGTSGGQSEYSLVRYNNTAFIAAKCWEKAVNTVYYEGITTVVDTDYELVFSNHQYLINGVSKTSTLSNPTFENTNPIVIFSDKFMGRLYYLKFTKGGTVVCDLIPVRVGQVGYLYDKVSGNLFGNSGTGNFILGPDK